jgi:hypothetical protein
MKKNSILFVIALMAAIAFAGSAQAAVVAQGGVNSTVADGEITTIWLDVNPSDYVTADVLDGGGAVIDYFYYSDLSPLLDRNGYSSGNTNIPVTVAMFCSGTERNIDGVTGSSYDNVDRNVTVVHFTVYSRLRRWTLLPVIIHGTGTMPGTRVYRPERNRDTPEPM